jgi:hypothetical protein
MTHHKIRKNKINELRNSNLRVQKCEREPEKLNGPHNGPEIRKIEQC